MKKAFAIFTALVLMPASQSMAWTGGPFSNNSRFSNGDEGIYEAVATTTNGMGLYRFSVDNDGVSAETGGGTAPNGSTLASSNVQFSAGLLGASSSNVWYYKGITYYGSAFGIVNSDARLVACVGNASSNSPFIGSAQGQAGNTPITPQTGVGGTNGVIINNPSGNNIAFANSSFTAKILTSKNKPVLRFKGTGEVSFVGEADIIADVEAINPVTITPGGVYTTNLQIQAGGLTSDPGNFVANTGITTESPTTSSGGGTQTSTAASAEYAGSFSGTTKVSTGGESGDFAQRGHVRKFVVFGSRVSTAVLP